MKGIKFLLMTMVAMVISIGAGAFGATIGLDPWATSGIVMASSLIPKGATGLMSGINVEIWQNFVVENLFKNNEFLMRSVDVSEFVLNGAVVHIPNAGNPSGIVRNRTNLPAQIKRRVDSDISYVLDEFTTDPVAILKADEVELSYDKMSSVLGEDMLALQELFADWMLYNWRVDTSTKRVLTTGDAVAAHTTNATGNRKAVTIADIKSLRLKMNKDNVPKAGRVLILDSDMFDQLTSDMTATQYRDFSSQLNVAEGSVGRLFGFDIYERSTVLVANSSNEIKEPGATGATTDRGVGLAWQETMVERAKGTIEAFEDLRNPTMYGDVYSFLVRGGGRKRRADNKGVYALIQDTAA